MLECKIYCVYERGHIMNCPKCGKVLPDNAANCKKCGTVFKENKGDAEMEAYIKKEKEKAAAKNEKLKKKGGKKPVNKGLIIGIVSAVVVVGVVLGLLFHFNIIGSRNNHKAEEKGPLNIEYTFEVDKDSVLMKMGDVEITEAEYEFFYRQSYSTLQNSVQLSFKEFVSKKLGDSFDETLINDYYDEYYQLNNSDLYVSSGIGTSRLKFRFLNNPLFNLYRIVNK